MFFCHKHGTPLVIRLMIPVIMIKNVLLQVTRVWDLISAESTTGAMLSVQTSSTPVGEGQPVVPGDLGKQAAEMLLEEIYKVRFILGSFIGS